MQRARIGVIATAVLAIATMAFAQKPDFSGTWAPDPSSMPAAPAGGGGGGMGGGGGRGMMGPMTVKQTATELSVTREGRNGAMTTTYKLDGSESDVTMGQMTAKVSAKWDGNTLVITQKTDMGESTQTWSLDAGTLTIERTGGRGAGKTVYKKAT